MSSGYAARNGCCLIPQIPGVDHAGIATQTVVERKMQKKLGVTRRDIGRENFVAKVWEWKEQYGDRINHQMVSPCQIS